MKNLRAVLAILLFTSMPLVAQSVTIGNDLNDANSGAGTIGGSIAQTYIDLSHPATATGSLTHAKFYWSTAGCPGGVEIKFYRRAGDTLKVTAERGPFNVTSNLMNVTLSPAVSVQAGDLIAITQLTACGNATGTTTASAGYLHYAGDVGDVAISAGFLNTTTLAVSASGDATEIVSRTIPVVGSAPGSFGSFFRTGMQLFNPYSVPVSGRLVFHRAGTVGIASDPSLSFTVSPRSVLAYADVVNSMGLTGIGSMDVMVPNGGSPPIVITRVFNDAGALGATGLYEEAVDVANTARIGNRLLDVGVTGFLVTPADPLATRMNIGIRTLNAGATLRVRLRSATGDLLKSFSKTYPSNWFEQTTVDSFVGQPIGANQTLEITIDAGSAIIYGSSTDNITNDPAIQFVVGTIAIT